MFRNKSTYHTFHENQTKLNKAKPNASKQSKSVKLIPFYLIKIQITNIFSKCTLSMYIITSVKSQVTNLWLIFGDQQVWMWLHTNIEDVLYCLSFLYYLPQISHPWSNQTDNLNVLCQTVQYGTHIYCLSLKWYSNATWQHPAYFLVIQYNCQTRVPTYC